jgi:hypothetical protein
MADQEQLATAVLTLKTDGGTIVSDLEKIKQSVKDVGGTISETSDAASSDWASMAKAITAVSKQLADQKAQLGDHTKSVGDLHAAYASFGGLLSTFDVHVREEILALNELSEAAGKTAAELGAIATAGLVVGAGVGGWSIGRAIAGFFALDTKIGNATAKLLGFGDVGAEAAANVATTLALASEHAGHAITDLSQAIAINTRWLEQHNEAAKTAAAAQKKLAEEAAAAARQFAAAIVELTSAGDGYQGTLDTINGSTVEAIKYYLDAGVSQGALATAYELTATQVKAVASAMEAEKKALDAAAQAQQKALDIQRLAIEQTTKLWDEYTALVIQHSGTATEAQLADIDRWAADLTAKVQKTGADTAEFYTALYALIDQKQQSVLVNWSAIATASEDVWKKTLQDTADKAAATYQYMTDHANQFRSDTIVAFGDVASAAQAAADDWYASWNDHLDQLDAHVASSAKSMQDSARETAAVMSGSVGGSYSLAGLAPEDQAAKAALLGGSVALDSNNNPYVYIQGVNAAPHREFGGPVSAGMPYVVGEKRPELFVPQSNGSILSGLGGGTTVNVNVAGSVLDTDRSFMRTLQKGIENALKNAGVRLGG